MLNADSLTNDAQSALRRCIELFSKNTRFFIIIEKKEKLLNPILSRFCIIHINDFVINNQIINLHQHFLNKKINLLNEKKIIQIWFDSNFDFEKIKTHKHCLQLTKDIYNKGYSCLDLLNFINSKKDLISELDISTINLCFHKVKLQIKNEELLIFYMLDFLFFRENKSLHHIL